MEFTDDELRYLSQAVSEHVNEVSDTFEDTREFIRKHSSAFYELSPRLKKMLTDMESGAGLLLRLNEEMKDEANYEENKSNIVENQEKIKALTDSLVEILKVCNKTEDE